MKSMNEAAHKIRTGTSVLIFPEGTRSANGHVQQFKKGGFHLALKSGGNIVPISIIDSHKIVPKGEQRIHSGRIIMNIGRPISVKDYSKKDMDRLMTLVRETIISQMNDLDRI